MKKLLLSSIFATLLCNVCMPVHAMQPRPGRPGLRPGIRPGQGGGGSGNLGGGVQDFLHQHYTDRVCSCSEGGVKDITAAITEAEKLQAQGLKQRMGSEINAQYRSLVNALTYIQALTNATDNATFDDAQKAIDAFPHAAYTKDLIAWMQRALNNSKDFLAGNTSVIVNIPPLGKGAIAQFTKQYLDLVNDLQSNSNLSNLAELEQKFAKFKAQENAPGTTSSMFKMWLKLMAGSDSYASGLTDLKHFAEAIKEAHN